LTQVETFRVGCIGHVDADGMRAAVKAIAEVLHEMCRSELAREEC
jgi:2-aminoethylphosphonate-pyruvate transaminase